MQKWCFILSLTMLGAFFIVSLVERHSKKLEKSQKWKLRIAKFIFLVIAGGSLFFGYKFFNDISFMGIAESLYSALKLFFADGTLYEAGPAPLPAGSTLSIAYFALYYVICGIAVYCTAAAVISIFKNIAALRELTRRGRRKNLCVFSELSEKTLAIAQSVYANTKNNEAASAPDKKTARKSFFSHPPYELDNKTNKLSFVFCEVFEQNAELYYELLDGAHKLGALCIKNDITEVHQRLRNAKCYKGSETRLTRYFLAGDDQAENVRQALFIADTERKTDSDKQRIKNLAIFTFATGEANGEVLSALNTVGNKKGTYFVRRLNPAVMLAHTILANEQNYLVGKADPDKDLQVLVAGMGQYGEQIIKMLCWFYQRRTGGITIHVVDREKGIENRMKAIYPGLTDYTQPEAATEDARFSLVFHEGVDLFSNAFSTLLKNNLADIDAAFITLGNDDINAEAAIHLRCLLDRAHYADITQETGRYLDSNTGEDLIRIFAIVHDNKRCENFAGGTPYNIRFVGNDSAVYAYQNIYDHQKEEEAVVIHKKKIRANTFDEAINSYNASEYVHLSSLARAYHNDFYCKLYGEDLSQENALEARRRTEKKRWNAYMRAYGYICMDLSLTAEQREAWFTSNYRGPKRNWARGKWHNSIAPYSQLGEKEQENNYNDFDISPKQE